MRRTRRLSIPGRYFLCWIGYMTMISTNIPRAIEQMQKFPIAVKTFISKQKEEEKKIFQLSFNDLGTFCDSVSCKKPILKMVIGLPSGNGQLGLWSPQGEQPCQKRCEPQLQSQLPQSHLVCMLNPNRHHLLVLS